MGRTLNRLNATHFKQAKEPGMYADGGGLYLRVAPAGTKSWIFRFAEGGKLRDMGLGSTNTVSLARARQRAGECRELRQQGLDPIAHQRAALAATRALQAKSLTFREAATRYIESHESAWGVKHHRAWAITLRDYAYPVLGDLPVRMIDTPLVMQVLAPLWKTKTETGTRLRGRIERILDWAKVSGLRDGENPARWRGHLDHLLPRRTKVRRVEHHVALPYSEIGAFMTKLRRDNGSAARCLQFTALTAVRLGEARHATWGEINFAAATWTIPATRMKGRKEHRVPLAPRAIELLEEMRAIRRGDLVFPGVHDGQPVAGITVLMLAKQMAGEPITVHGFRSTFRDWCAEQTNFPRELAELALAHAVGSDVERAYQRGDMLERRRKLMEAWAEFCSKPQSARR